MEQMYNVSSNPHIRDKMTTSRIMQLVVIALLPTTLFGIWNFGVHALLVVLATVASVGHTAIQKTHWMQPSPALQGVHALQSSRYRKVLSAEVRSLPAA